MKLTRRRLNQLIREALEPQSQEVALIHSLSKQERDELSSALSDTHFIKPMSRRRFIFGLSGLMLAGSGAPVVHSMLGNSAPRDEESRARLLDLLRSREGTSIVKGYGQNEMFAADRASLEKFVYDYVLSDHELYQIMSRRIGDLEAYQQFSQDVDSRHEDLVRELVELLEVSSTVHTRSALWDVVNESIHSVYAEILESVFAQFDKQTHTSSDNVSQIKSGDSEDDPEVDISF